MIDLKGLAKKYPDSLDNAKKLKAYLTDLYPNENKKLIDAIVEAFECGVAEKIKTNPKLSDTAIISYCKKVNKSGTYSESVCRSCINLWMDLYNDQVDSASGKTGKSLFGLIRHTHKYLDSYVAPTCTSEGYTLHRCKCGESYKDNIVPKKEHNYSIVSRITSSCTKDGTITYRCSQCTNQYSETIAKVPHHYSVIDSKKASCNQEGYKTYRCSVCGNEYVTKIPALVHHFSSWVTTKTKTGYKERQCSICKKIEYRRDPSINKVGIPKNRKSNRKHKKANQ